MTKEKILATLRALSVEQYADFLDAMRDEDEALNVPEFADPKIEVEYMDGYPFDWYVRFWDGSVLCETNYEDFIDCALGNSGFDSEEEFAAHIYEHYNDIYYNAGIFNEN